MAIDFDDVLMGNLCSGCGACAAIAPDVLEMRVTQDGVLRPFVQGPLSEKQNALVQTACPGIGQNLEPNGRMVHPVWGPFVECKRGYAADPEIRENGASGGALSALLVSLLTSGRVDGVIHVGADPEKPLQNVTYVSHTRAEVLANASSRYAPSSPLNSIPEILAGGRSYAFVGKPCDVSAVAAWRESDPTLARSIPILVSFLCAGVPSLRGAEQVSGAIGIPPDQLNSFSYRGPGWPGLAVGASQSGEVGEMTYADSWGDILSKHLQHRCKICADGTGVFADVVFGDAWEADPGGYPDFADRPGQSAILVRTDLGAQLMSEAADAVITGPLDPDDLAKMQPGQMRRRRVVLARLAALAVTGRAAPRFTGFGLKQMTLSATPTELLRNFFGMMRRSLALPRKGRRIC